MTRIQDLIRLGQNPFQLHPTDADETVSLLEECRVLVVGAGGLGSQVLKALALCGIRNIHVVDMDTLEMSNLNRQVLFRDEDIGQPKAVAAARRLKLMLPRLELLKVTPHNCKIQEFDPHFFRQFNAVIAGLDNVEARQWLNATLCELVHFKEDGSGALQPDVSTIIPLLDGGTEGFMGHCRIILPGLTACFECTLAAFAPRNETYPLCTVVDRPRLPEHCVAYALVVRWAKERPGKAADYDDPADVKWLYDRAMERAQEFGIEGVTPELTLGVVKRIMPAIASTNQSIGFLLVSECVKILTGIYPLAGTYMMQNATYGCHLATLNLDCDEKCAVCSRDVLCGVCVCVQPSETLREVIKRTEWKQPIIRTYAKLLYSPRQLATQTISHEEMQSRLDLTVPELVKQGLLRMYNERQIEPVFVETEGRDVRLLVRLSVAL